VGFLSITDRLWNGAAHFDGNPVSQQLLEYIAAGYFPSTSPTVRCRWGTDELNRRLGKTAAVAEDLNTGIVIETKATTTGWTMSRICGPPEGAKRCSSRRTRPRTDFTWGQRR
jgi:hypothetical protein